MKKAKTENKTLFITAEQDGFTIITNNITRNNLLSDGAKSLYIYLKSHSETFNLSHESIANYLKKSVATIKREINELKQSGFLILEKKQKSNTYYYKLLNSPKLEKIKSLNKDFLIDMTCKGQLSFKDLKDLVKTNKINEKDYNEIINKIIEIAKSKTWLESED